jgi:very-short-patch-repair endonuclease
MSWPHRQIAALSEAQQGQVSHAQLLELGLGRGGISYGLRIGRIFETFRRVYGVGDRALPQLWREMGAVLACGEGSFVSRQSAIAACVYGARGGAEVDVTVPYGRSARRDGIRIHRAKCIDHRDVTELDRVPISTPAFALLEVAPALSAEQFERAFDDALTRRVMTLADAQDTLGRHPGRAGSRLYAEFALPEHGLEITRSTAEQLMKAIVRNGGLPVPRINLRRGRIIPDFVWRPEKVVVEVDGYRTHGTRRAFESDRARDAKLAAAGWIVLRFTWRQLTNEPMLVLARLAQTLALRSAAA